MKRRHRIAAATIIIAIAAAAGLAQAAPPARTASAGTPPRAQPQPERTARGAPGAPPSARQQAGVDTGYYREIPWRSNDPFVFCKYGPPADHCWKPINPILGLWVPTCLPYTQPNMASVAYFVSVCPHAEEEGEWVPDNDGTPTTTPYVH